MVTFNVVTTTSPKLILRFTNSNGLFTIKSERVLVLSDADFQEALVNVLQQRVKQISVDDLLIELNEGFFFSLAPNGDLDVYGSAKVFSKLEYVEQP